MKKVFSLVLFVILTVAVSVTAFAADSDIIASGYCGGEGDGTNLEWVLTEDGTLTISGEGEMADYEYGKLENGQWDVNSPWYEHSEQIKTLVIKEGITRIGDCAFRELSNVSGELVIPKSVAEIGMQSFYGSQFDGNLVIPGNVKTIGSEAFCEWRSVEYNFTDKVIISEGVETIGDGAFAFGYFKSITIPSTVKSLGKGIFSFDGFLNEITINENNKYYCIEDGIIYTKDIKILKECLMKKTGDFIVPESVETIEKEAFWNTGLSSVTVTKNVKYIGAGAFGRCYYPIYIEGQLNYIGENAFNISRGSSDVYFLGGAPKEVVYNPNNSYMSSFNENINIYYLEGTEGWEVDENGLWNGFKVTPFTVGEEVELDPSLYVASGYCGNDSLISGKNLAWGIDKNGVLKIFGKGKMDSYSNPMSMRGGGEIIVTAGIAPWYEYEGKLTGLVIEEGITNIGSYAFWSMDIPGEIIIPSTVKIIEDWSFCGNDFVGDDIIIPEGVEKIGNAAFQAAGTFENAYIPASVIDIQGEPFRYCETKNIFTDENNQYYKSVDGVFFTKDGKELVQFPDGRTGSYVVPETVTVIGRSAFESSLLSSVMIEGNIDSVENVAFQNFNGTIVFNGTVSEIAGAAFSTSSIKENKLKVIFMAGPPKTFIAGDEWSNSFGEGCAIYYLSGTEDLWSFDEKGLWNGYEVNEINAEDVIIASGYCGGEGDGTNLEWTITADGALTISGTGKMADYGDFGQTYMEDAPWKQYKDQIKSLVIEEGVTSIGGCAFYKSSFIKGKLVLPETVTRIGVGAFAYCDGLSGELVIPESVMYIDSHAFFYCRGLNGNLEIGEKVSSLDSSSFSGTGIENISVSDNNTKYCSVDGILYSKDLKTLILCPGGKTGSIVIPKLVERIEWDSFRDCQNLTGSITLPDSIVTIGRMAFESCSIDEYYFRGDAPSGIIVNGTGMPNFDYDDTIYYPEGNATWVIENEKWKGYNAVAWEVPFEIGDINQDRKVDVKDVYLARLAAAKLVIPTEEEFSLGDVDGNGRINAIDANLIRKFCANIITKFPVEG